MNITAYKWFSAFALDGTWWKRTSRRMPSERDLRRRLTTLDVEQSGHDAGLLDRPSPSAAGPSALETQVANLFAGAADEVRRWMLSEVAQLAEQAGRCAVDERDRAARGTAQNAREAFEASLPESKRRMGNAWSDVQSTGRQLAHFATRHRRRLPARYPPSLAPTVLLFVIVAIGEVAVNLRLLGMDLPGGDLAGAAVAAGISLVNIAAAILLGRLALPQCLHIRLARRIGGVVATLPCVAAGVAINLVAGSYRLAIETSSANAPLSVDLATVLMAPIAILQSLPATLLTAIGLCIFAVGTSKAFLADDAYPGYGHRDRAHGASRTHFDTAVAAENTVISRRCDDLCASLEDTVEAVEEKRRRSMEILRRARLVVSAALDKGRALERGLEAELRLFREANRRIRSSRPPAHFDCFPAIVVADEGIVASLDAHLQLLSADSSALLDNLRAQRMAMHSVKTECVKRFEALVAEIKASQDLGPSPGSPTPLPTVTEP
jgi:hypothetical protein